MNILTLSIKQKFFDQIISGEKKQEFREIRPKNAKKYIKYICDGKEYGADEDLPENGAVDVMPIKYDAIKFLTGEYKGKRPFAVVEVKDAKVQLLTDENGEDIVYEENGIEYILSQIVYELGDIIERSNY